MAWRRSRKNDDLISIGDDHAWWADRSDEEMLPPRPGPEPEPQAAPIGIEPLSVVELAKAWMTDVDSVEPARAQTVPVTTAVPAATIDLTDADEYEPFDPGALVIDLRDADAATAEQLSFDSVLEGAFTAADADARVWEPIRADAWFLSR